jgi:hypothetical protein
MTELEPITGPDGLPYPATVQHFAATYLVNLDDQARQTLVDALEAAAAVRAEHPAPVVDPDAAPDDSHAERLFSVFMSGFSSGIATLLMNGGAPAGHMPNPVLTPMTADAMRHYADRFAYRSFGDPLVREQMIADVVKLFDRGEQSTLNATSYAPTHPDHDHPKGTDS